MHLNKMFTCCTIVSFSKAKVMVGWLFFLTVFWSYQDDGRMKSKALEPPSQKDFYLQQVSNPGPLDQQAKT